MVTFLPQARPISPVNTTPTQLARIGQAIGQGIENRNERRRAEQERSRLAEIGEMVQGGDLNAAAAMAFQQGQPQVGLNLLAQQAAAQQRQQITPFQQAQLNMQQQRLDRTPAPLTFEQRMQLAQAGRAPRETAEQRAEATQRVKQRGEREALQRGGQQVLRAVQGLRSKIGSTGPAATPQQRAAADRFESATGPVEGTFLGGGLNPFRSSENLTMLRQVQQDAQAINTQMQRALLKGGGQITENEREQINQILGSIATARNANQAAALLDNFENIVRGIFDMGEASGTVNQAQSTGVINFNDLPE